MRRIGITKTVGVKRECSIDSLRWAHSALHVERAHVLPVLLEQRDEEVGGERQVRHELLLRHVHVADAQAETQRLLHLELNRRAHLYAAEQQDTVQVFKSKFEPKRYTLIKL